jgi:hypothetical protein
MSGYVVLALAASTLAGVGLNQASSAQALSDRRLCMYGKYHVGDVWTWVVANYKKNRTCPYVDPDKHRGLVSGDPNKIKQLTCEEFSSFIGYRDDVCRVLEVDSLYRVVFNQLTYEPATRTLLGHLNDFD